MEPASGTGSGRSKTEFTTPKVAVLAAIQTAMVRTTVTVNPLSPISERTACRRLRNAVPIIANTQPGRAGVAEIGNLLQRLLQIRNQIVGMLEAHRNPQEVLRRAS